MTFHQDVLRIDPAAESSRIGTALRENVYNVMRRYGVVVGVSGGVDSAVVLGLCVKALGAAKVTAIMMPEKDSDPDSERLARTVAATYGVTPLLETITPALDGFACYSRRDEAIRRLFPQFDAAQGYTVKIGLPQNLLDADTLNVFSLTIVSPAGEESTRPLGVRELREIVAASNFKQRARMSLLYYHAERNNYAVIGTANKNEHDQGFFVKYGDSGVDFQAVSHLYKTQIYQLAEYLDVPEEVRKRPPTTDTYSARSTQREFFFRLPFETMDLLCFAQEHNVPMPEITAVMGLSETQVRRAFNEFSQKRRTTHYLRTAPVHLRAVDEPERQSVVSFPESHIGLGATVGIQSNTV
jgi:NAD+ synthase